MAKIFTTVIKRVTVNAGGQPTFVYNETTRRSEGVSFPKLAISDTQRRADSITLKPVVNDALARVDAYRIPTATVTPPDAIKKTDSPNVPLLQTSDKYKKTDVSTTAVLYTSTGAKSFTVPAGVTSLIIEGLAPGGGGGAGAAGGGGGGGGGGGYGKLTLSVVAGDIIAFTISAGAAIGATGATMTITRNGSTVMTCTGGGLGGGASLTAAGTGGAGGTASGTGVTSTTGGTGANGTATTGGNGGNGAGPFGGTGGAGATTAAAAGPAGLYGAGGGGGTTFGVASTGSQGAVRLTFSV